MRCVGTPYIMRRMPDPYLHKAVVGLASLSTPVVPFFPFCLGVSLLKLNGRKKGTIIIKGLLGNLVPVEMYGSRGSASWSRKPEPHSKLQSEASWTSKP